MEKIRHDPIPKLDNTNCTCVGNKCTCVERVQLAFRLTSHDVKVGQHALLGMSPSELLEMQQFNIQQVSDAELKRLVAYQNKQEKLVSGKSSNLVAASCKKEKLVSGKSNLVADKCRTEKLIPCTSKDLTAHKKDTQSTRKKQTAPQRSSNIRLLKP